MLKRIGTALGLLVLCAISILRTTRPPAIVPATAPDTVFSAERAMRHVEQIAVRPHAIGMPDHDRVRDYIIGQLGALGLRSQVQATTAIATRNRQAGHVQNILAWVPGGGPKSKAVLIVAHYDGVEAGPAAADDGAGSAAILETLRALRATKRPLAHDVFVLFSDGEEAGLLGAAAFARAHPWARDVGFILNFEARGTSGRSFMFETGRGNLDAARVLRGVRGVTAGSVFTAVYRALPNDTDLSELSVLDVPALNFAFIDGVERYHTSRDDIAHLNVGSLQHHGAQMLALTRLLANGPMPRPETGDADFFDLPLVGLVVYPVGFAIPLAVIALVLVAVLLARDRRGVLVGVGAALAAVVLSSAVGLFAGRLVSGPAVWSGLYGLALALAVLAITLACWAVAARWSSVSGLHTGALIVWAALALLTAIAVPGASYLFVWPLLFAATAALLPRYAEVGEWFAAVITLLLLAGLAATVAVIALGLAGPGSIALALLTSLMALLLGPQLVRIAGGARLLGAPWIAGLAAIVAIIGMVVVKPSEAHPIPTALAYAENADSATAWFGALSPNTDPWTRSVVGDARPSPAWTRTLTGGNRFTGRPVAAVALAAPVAEFIRDTILGDLRRIVLRVTAPPGTTGLRMRVTGAPVLAASIDGSVMDTTRFRRASSVWSTEFMAVPDAGAVVALSVPRDAHIDFQLTARRPGLPSLPGVMIPPRPANVATIQVGDASYVVKGWRF